MENEKVVVMVGVEYAIKVLPVGLLVLSLKVTTWLAIEIPWPEGPAPLANSSAVCDFPARALTIATTSR